jgi:predicted RNase H-like HicB family nuclease
MRYAIVYRDEDDNWIAEVPSLPGCVSQGETRAQALENIQDAIRLYLEDLDDEQKELYQDYRNPELVLIEAVAE